MDKPIDWNQIRVLAVSHRVHPLLYQRLAEHTPGLVPEPLLAQLTKEFRAGVAHNVRLTGELVALCGAFAGAGIAVLPHKGPVLAQMAYRDLALRHMADLDLLVRPEDLGRSIALLAANGYTPQEGSASLSPSALLRWAADMTYWSPRGIYVEIHWRLTPSHSTLRIDHEVLWRSRTSVAVAGMELPALAPEALVLLLAVHGAKHCWDAIGWVADIAWLVDANPGFSWKRTEELARQAGCGRPVALARSLVGAVFHDQPTTDPLCRRVIDRWYYGPAQPPDTREVFSFASALSQSQLDIVRHWVGLAFWPTEADWKLRRWPEGLFWLYTPARMARLVGKYLR